MQLNKRSPEFITHISKVSEAISGDEDFHVAQEKEYSSLHNLLESEVMQLGDLANLRYTRRPDLLASYFESLQLPGIITDSQNQFIAAINKTKIIRDGIFQDVYYASDLRISKDASLRIKARFRKSYQALIQELNGEVYTAVLKENQAAIKAFSSKKHQLFYHPVYEYVSRSILVLPTLRMLKSRYQHIKIKQGRDEVYEARKQKTCSFCHLTGEWDSYFQLKIEGKTIGAFTIARPKNRSLLVEPKRRSTNWWLKLAKFFFNFDYSEKLPWVYLTSLYIDPDFDKSEMMKLIIKYLYQQKIINSGELLLLCHGQTEQITLRLPTPQVVTNGILFLVSTQEQFSSLDGEVHINPICL